MTWILVGIVRLTQRLVRRRWIRADAERRVAALEGVVHAMTGRRPS